MVSKKKKELYHTNILGNFRDPEVLMFFAHVTNSQHRLSLRKQKIKEMKFVKKQILFKFFNQSWIGSKKPLNGKLFIFCGQYDHLNMISFHQILLKEVSLLGVYWKNFYFSHFFLTSTKRWNDSIQAKNLMELQANVKMFFFQNMSSYFSIHDFLAKSLFSLEQTIYFKIFLCRA